MSTTTRTGEVRSEAPTAGNGEETPLLQVSNLQVYLPTGSRSEVEATRSVSLSVHRGERVGIVGESGSGKTVTGRAAAGLLPTSPRVRVKGSIKFAGREMVGAPPKAWDEVRAKTVGMIFQDPLTYLNPVMKIGTQVRESISPDRRGHDRGDEVLRCLSLAGLEDVGELAERFPHELSGGMRQRVLIAIAVAKKPDLLVADEPTTALDATVQQRVLQTLDETVTELGTSLILISHDIAVVSGMTDRIYVMYDGCVVESGATRDVLENPEHPYTQALLRSVRSLTEEGMELYSIPDSLRASWAREEQAHAS
ncbi:ABC transporter ATP-binding protein [Georgenia halophila]|uniref:ABC transporter ATP-binding protein n=1 Tax=Georgenia halophila TaxID=620889 RepID=A0ABP8KT85_9MICO